MPSWAWLALAAAALLGLVAPLAAAESISGDREQQAEGYRVSLLKDGAVNTWKSYLHSYTSYTTRNWYTRGRVDETKTRVERQRGENIIANFLTHDRVFDAAYYIKRHLDRHYSEDRAKDHWIRSGAARGYRASPDFDVNEYLERYPDVKTIVGPSLRNAVLHYYWIGFSQEQRQGRACQTPDDAYTLETFATGWTAAVAVCAADNKRLCSSSEICPGGAGKEPLRGMTPTNPVWKMPSGSLKTYAPVSDEDNAWLNLGPGEDMCKTYREAKFKAPGADFRNGEKSAYLCCPKSPQIIDCATAKEHTKVVLDCNGGLVDEILFASYGVPEGTCKPGCTGDLHTNIVCNRDARDLVSGRCKGKFGCEIDVSNDLFGSYSPGPMVEVEDNGKKFWWHWKEGMWEGKHYGDACYHSALSPGVSIAGTDKHMTIGYRCTPPVPPPPPNAPVLVKAEVKSLSMSFKQPTAAESGALPAIKFVVQYRKAGVGNAFEQTGPPLEGAKAGIPMNFTMPDLESGTAYEFRSKSMNTDGIKSTWSLGTVMKTKTPPPPPPTPKEDQKFVLKMSVNTDPAIFYEASRVNTFLKTLSTALGVDVSTVKLRSSAASPPASFLELRVLSAGLQIEIEIVGPNAADGANKMQELASAGAGVLDSLGVDATSIKISETALKEIVAVIEIDVAQAMMGDIQQDSSLFANNLCTLLGVTNGTLAITKINGKALPKASLPSGDADKDAEEAPDPEPELPDPPSSTNATKAGGGAAGKAAGGAATPAAAAPAATAPVGNASGAAFMDLGEFLEMKDNSSAPAGSNESTPADTVGAPSSNASAAGGASAGGNASAAPAGGNASAAPAGGNASAGNASKGAEAGAEAGAAGGEAVAASVSTLELTATSLEAHKAALAMKNLKMTSSPALKAMGIVLKSIQVDEQDRTPNTTAVKTDHEIAKAKAVQAKKAELRALKMAREDAANKTASTTPQKGKVTLPVMFNTTEIAAKALEKKRAAQAANATKAGNGTAAGGGTAGNGTKPAGSNNATTGGNTTAKTSIQAATKSEDENNLVLHDGVTSVKRLRVGKLLL